MNQVCIMLLFLKSFMPKSINFTIQELLIIQNTIQVFKFNEDCPRSIKLDSYKFHAITLVLLFFFLLIWMTIMTVCSFTTHYRSFFFIWL